MRIIGAVAGLLCASPPSVAALEYVKLTSRGGTPVLLLHGRIEADELSRFQDNFFRMQPVKEVWLSSGGGNIAASIEVGRRLRAEEMVVRVPSLSRMEAAFERSFSDDHLRVYRSRYLSEQPLCASACGMLLAGGEVRLVDVTRTVGVHSLSVDRSPENQNRTLGGAAQIGGAWAIYMLDMGVKEDYLRKALSIGPRCMYYLSEAEMRRWAVSQLGRPILPSRDSVRNEVRLPADTGNCWK